jgi:hypothetical protein
MASLSCRATSASRSANQAPQRPDAFPFQQQNRLDQRPVVNPITSRPLKDNVFW